MELNLEEMLAFRDAAYMMPQENRESTSGPQYPLDYQDYKLEMEDQCPPYRL